jgi:hypothetical protein
MPKVTMKQSLKGVEVLKGFKIESQGANCAWAYGPVVIQIAVDTTFNEILNGDSNKNRNKIFHGGLFDEEGCLLSMLGEQGEGVASWEEVILFIEKATSLPKV